MGPKFAGRDEDIATTSEVREAIKSLKPADYVRLMLLAKVFAKTRIRGTVVEPDDLVQDAIAKTLEGHRHWKKGVSILQHLGRVIESDSGHVAEKHASHGPIPIEEGSCEPVAHAPNPMAQMEAHQELEMLLEPFEEDETALQVLRLKSRGFSPSEIQRELGFGRTQYETVLKRIRRRLCMAKRGGQP